MNILHDYSMIDGEVVMVLKDKSVLDSSEDELENLELLEKEKIMYRKKYRTDKTLDPSNMKRKRFISLVENDGIVDMKEGKKLKKRVKRKKKRKKVKKKVGKDDVNFGSRRRNKRNLRKRDKSMNNNVDPENIRLGNNEYLDFFIPNKKIERSVIDFNIDENDVKNVIDDEKGVIFDSLTEFCNRLNVDNEDEDEDIKNEIKIKKKKKRKLKRNIRKKEEETTNKLIVENNKQDMIIEKGEEEEEEEEEGIENIMEEEEIISPSLGIAAALKFVNKKKIVKRASIIPPQKETKIKNQKKDDNKLNEITLDHYDNFGRKLNQKDAYRFLSHKFHGVVPGKNKMEKYKKQIFEERKIKNMELNDTPLGGLTNLKNIQKNQKNYFIRYKGDVKDLVGVANKEDHQKKKKKKRKRKDNNDDNQNNYPPSKRMKIK